MFRSCQRLALPMKSSVLSSAGAADSVRPAESDAGPPDRAATFDPWFPRTPSRMHTALTRNMMETGHAAFPGVMAINATASSGASLPPIPPASRPADRYLPPSAAAFRDTAIAAFADRDPHRPD